MNFYLCLPCSPDTGCWWYSGDSMELAMFIIVAQNPYR